MLARAAAIVKDIRVHPRIAYQGRFQSAAAREALIARLPDLLPFRRQYHAAIAIVDWDHRLPTQQVAVRIYAYYDHLALAAGGSAYDDRLEEIGTRDRYPEFDVPDFADLPADEAYEVELDEGGRVVGCRLTSSWRREVAPVDSLEAVGIARASEEFARLAAAVLDRPRHLGDLEAVAWTPPCESGYGRWTVDVWYLMAFDGRMGTGRSLLVDLGERRVVAVRDFSVRSG